MGKVSLSDIVNMPAFEEAGSLFHKATGMAISFYDEGGQVVFYPAQIRCEFCHLVQSTPEGRMRCQESDKSAAKKALATGKPTSYTCHAGLVDVVVPVVVAGRQIGCFYSGQSLITPPTAMGYQEVRTRVVDLSLDADRLWDYYQAVPVVDESRLQTSIGLLSIICNHLVEGEMAIRSERALTSEQRKLRKAAEERVRLERDLREMELRLLQAQINPHFLFNALNLIMGQSIVENASQTTHLVDKLALLLRNSLSKVGSMISLADEIDSAKAFVDIFSARFGKKICVQIDIPKSLHGFQVPALMLQPLIENALVHALPKCDSQFSLNIGVVGVDKGAEIVVADNGPSIGHDNCEAIQRLLRDSSPECKLTGLIGVNRRLKYYYHGIDDLQIDPTHGFKVTIRIPISG